MIHGKQEALGISGDSILAGARKLVERNGFDTRMTSGEAFAKLQQQYGIEHVFAIIGAAFMPISDLFPVVRCPSSTPRNQ